MQAQEAERSGHLVIKVSNLGYWYENKPLINNLSTTIMRGDKIGVIGPNGSGKTTLLRLLLGQMTPRGAKCAWGRTWRSRITTSCANSSMKKNGDGECQRRERYHHDQR